MFGIFNSNQNKKPIEYTCNSSDGFMRDTILKASGSSHAGDIYTKQFQRRGNLKALEEEEEKEESETQEKKNIDIYVNVLPVVDPVKGKPVERLSLGDKIYVKIIEDKAIAEAVGKELNRTVDDIKDIAPCTLKKIEKTETGSFELEVLLQEGVIGKTIVKPEVRIKLVNPPKVEEVKNQELSPMVYVYFAIGALVIVAIIVIILILR